MLCNAVDRFFCFKPYFLTLILSVLVLASCGGGSSSPPLDLGGGSGPEASEPVDGESVSAPDTENEEEGDEQGDCTSLSASSALDTVTLSGAVTFDFVPHNRSRNSLDYNATFSKPARGVEVVVLDGCNDTFETSVTDGDGVYRFDVPVNSEVRVRVNARLVASDGASWDFSVTDNTQGNARYILQGALINSGGTDSSRDFHAASGWGGTSYTSPRSAAPFAILDTVYEALQLLTAVDETLAFPPAEFRWSVLNTTAFGELSEGDVGTSFFYPLDGHIYLLGMENNDTDEYDQHVVAHEFWHYFESNFARSDSMGGDHGEGDRLDFRVAFSEGAGNAFSGMVLNDPLYTDSLGNRQSAGFSFNLENNAVFNAGWFSESSVQSILYDLYDVSGAEDGADVIDDAFFELYSVVTSNAFVNSNAMIGIHLFLNELKVQFPTLSEAVEALATQQNVTVNDGYGTGELNDGGEAGVLPLYKTASVGGVAEVCSNNAFGHFNKLANRQLLALNISSSGSYTIAVNRTSGLSSSDPDVLLWRNGDLVGSGETVEENAETLELFLDAGDYVVEVYEYANIDASLPGSGEVCFDVEIN